MEIDMTRPDRQLVAGIDLWEVMKVEAEKSRGNDPMLNVKLFRVSDRNDHMFDVVMLAGNGWGIGKRKLIALGVPDTHKGPIDTLDFVGRRVWAATVVNSYQGRDSLKVDINNKALKYAGLQPAAMVPEGCTMPAEAPLGEPTPF